MSFNYMVGKVFHNVAHLLIFGGCQHWIFGKCYDPVREDTRGAERDIPAHLSTNDFCISFVQLVCLKISEGQIDRNLFSIDVSFK